MRREGGYRENPSEGVERKAHECMAFVYQLRVVGSRGGSRYVEGCWWLPYLKSSKIACFKIASMCSRVEVLVVWGFELFEMFFMIEIHFEMLSMIEIVSSLRTQHSYV